ncbi:MAG: hypothetical protein R6U88_05095 [Candidatus Bipolaricaulota bacterium]
MEMTWEEFLRRFGNCPVIEPAMVYAGQSHPHALQVQLSRWVRAGRLLKLARGKYMLAEPYRKADPPLEHVANALVYPSYVSLERALSWHRMIPEAVPVVTSVTPAKARWYETPVGSFSFRHIHPRLFWGYEAEHQGGFSCVVALPEKALLDLAHLWRGKITESTIKELRLQNLEIVYPERLDRFAQRIGGSKVKQAAAWVLAERERMAREYERL